MSLPAFAARRRVTVAMLTLTLVLFGLIGLGGLKVNLLPDLSYPTLTVRTDDAGAAPTEIEYLISQPVEEAVGVVKGVRNVHSVSRAGQSDVILSFAWGTDMDQAGLSVRDKLDTLQLPLTAKKPLLLRFNPSTDPVMRLALTAPAGAADHPDELKRLRRYADLELRKKLEPVRGVAAVKVGGGLEDEIEVAVDQQKLAQLGLDIDTIVTRLKQENVNISGGRIDEGSQRYLVRTVNQFQDLAQMRDMLVAANQGVPVRLKDIAEVRQGHKERKGVARVDGREAIELAVYKEGDANTVSVADGVRAVLTTLQKNLPPGAQIDVIDDQSVFIRHALDEVRGDALLGGVLAVLVIFLFLGDGASTAIVALSLPVSLVATFFFMDQLGLSLNLMSLSGLALATGMVVDDSIVVLENIARLRAGGASILDAAVHGAAEVGMAVTASTLTTVAVFFPLVFVQGVAGQLFRDQALTVTFAMLVSLLVAMSLIPMLAALRIRAPLAYREEYAPPPPVRWQGVPARALAWLLVGAARLLARGIGPLMRWASRCVLALYEPAAAAYVRLLPRALVHPGRVLGTAALALAVALALVPGLGLDLIPQLAQNRFEMTATLAPGTPLAATDALVRQLSLAHRRDTGVAQIYGVAGEGTRLDANPTESGENIARLNFTMQPGVGTAGERAEIARLRVALAEVPGVQVKFGRPQLLSFSAPLEVEIRGESLPALARAGQRLEAAMKASGRYTDVRSTVEVGVPEIRIRFDQDRAAALGLTTRAIADEIVRKVRGEVATQYDDHDRKIDVRVRVRPGERRSLADVRDLIVGGTPQAPIRLSAIAEVSATTGPAEIHRIGQQRVAILSAGLAHGDLEGGIAEVRRLLTAHPLPAGLSAHIGGQGEELGTSTRSLLFALGLAMFLVYLVMASQFESLLHPFVIMFSVPLAMVGAVLALKMTGSSLSVVVFIGLIMLVGIVVKNAIVLIDRVNRLREAGVAKRDALMQAASSRLRPITMTTLCTLIGFLPLALGRGDGAEVRAPMAITVIGGLLVSTLLTLVVIPVVYDLLDRRGDAWYAARGARHRGTAEAGGDADADGAPPASEAPGA